MIGKCNEGIGTELSLRTWKPPHRHPDIRAKPSPLGLRLRHISCRHRDHSLCRIDNPTSTNQLIGPSIDHCLGTLPPSLNYNLYIPQHTDIHPNPNFKITLSTAAAQDDTRYDRLDLYFLHSSCITTQTTASCMALGSPC